MQSTQLLQTANDSKSNAPQASNAQTLALVKAIEDGDITNVLKCIQAGAQLNTLVKTKLISNFVSKNNSNEIPELTTPLGIACHKLDYDIVKILLENGANPNLLGSDNRSIVELIMMGIEMLDLETFLNEPKEHILHIDGKQLNTSIVNNEVINVAGRILDLLLCYDLNPNFEWTSLFLEGTQHLASAKDYGHKARERQTVLISMIELLNLLISKTTNPKETEDMSQFVLKAKQKLTDNGLFSIPDFLVTVPEVKQKVVEASVVIKQEKEKLSLNHKKLGVSILNTSKEIAEQHHKAKSSVSFWKSAVAQKPLDNKLDTQSTNNLKK